MHVFKISTAVGFHMTFSKVFSYSCWLVFVNLIQTRDTWEEGTSVEELAPLDEPVGVSVEYCLD